MLSQRRPMVSIAGAVVYNLAMNRTIALAIWAMVLLLLVGCTNARRPETLMWADGQELPILRQQAGSYSSISRSLRLVIHNQGDLAMLPLTVEPVDFDREMVLLAAAGPTLSGQCGIRIQEVRRIGSTLRARVERLFPAPDAPYRSTRASPYHLVVVPKCVLNVVGFDAKIDPDALSATR